MAKRENGFYWIKHNLDGGDVSWEIAEWHDDCWIRAVETAGEVGAELNVVGEKIRPPEADNSTES